MILPVFRNEQQIRRHRGCLSKKTGDLFKQLKRQEILQNLSRFLSGGRDSFLKKA